MTFDGTTPAVGGTASAVTEAAARLPIHAGDFLALETPNSSYVSFRAPAAGTTGGRLLLGANDGQIASQGMIDGPTTAAIAAPVQVVIEPDADSDGFGDETQDLCVGTAGAGSGCPPGSISGTVANGAGAVVFIDSNGDGSFEDGEPSAPVNAAGLYTLPGVGEGDYSVRVRPVFMTTCDPGCAQTVSVRGNAAVANFTLFIAPTGPGGTGGSGGPGGTGGGGADPVDRTGPVLSPLSLGHASFAVNPKGAAAAKAKPKKSKAAQGTTLKFTSSEAGTGTFTISTVKKVKGKSRTSPVAAFHATVRSGRNAITFSGRVKIGSATKRLAIGSYKVSLVELDAAKNRSNTVTATFKLVR